MHLLYLKERLKMYKIPTLTAIFGTPVAFLLGEWTPLLSALVVFVALDIITGIMKGIYDRKLRSRRMSQGMIRKCLIFVVVIVANVIDVSMSPFLGAIDPDLSGLPLAKTGVILFYIVMELLSITENLGQMDFPIPKTLKDYIEVLRVKSDFEKPVEKVDEIIVKKDGEEKVLETKD